MRNWYYSAALLVVYLATFHLWKLHPGREFFVGCGLVATGVSGLGLWLSARRGYFVDRADLAYHLLVVVDLLVEGFVFELHKTLVILGVFATEQPARAFHRDYSFYYCALAFAFLIGRRRWLGLRRAAGLRAAL